jgi:hypothetical protein
VRTADSKWERSFKKWTFCRFLQAFEIRT